jgi:hypothetical protein
VSPTGFEPENLPISKNTTSGSSLSNSARKRSKAGKNHKVTIGPPVNMRMVENMPPTLLGTSSDHNIPITKHNRAITGEDLPQDLQAVVEAWPEHPEAIRAGIVAMVKVAKGDEKP